MGFCRRCGDIVVGERCKCGGTAVAATLQWSQGNPREEEVDKWSKTYVAKENTPVLNRRSLAMDSAPVPAQQTGGNPTKRFSVPLSTPLSSRVSDYIASATAERPETPKRASAFLHESPTSAAAQGILTSPTTGVLSKAYGSVLQPKETLANLTCNACLVAFTPDGTMYPDPSSSSLNDARFLCRSCFVSNGGTKGDCDSCGRPVLVLKSEGGFVENSGRVWHRRCFTCEGCFKNISDRPMIDLLGKPCCADCFDACLKRPTSRRVSQERGRDDPDGKKSNLGGTVGVRKGQNRESSPALEELEGRLGIERTKQASPVTAERVKKLNTGPRSSLGGDPKTSALLEFPRRSESPPFDSIESRMEASLSMTDTSPKTSSERRRGRYSSSGSPDKPDPHAVEEMKRRFLKSSASSTSSASISSPLTSPISPLSLAADNGRELQNWTTPKVPNTRIPRSFGARDLGTRNRKQSAHSSLRKNSESASVPPLTPDLLSDSDSQSNSSLSGSSGAVTPPDMVKGSSSAGRAYTGRARVFDGDEEQQAPHDDVTTTPTPTSKSLKRHTTGNIAFPSPPEPSASASPPAAVCAKCSLPLLAIQFGGKFVTVPEEPSTSGVPPKTYHTECFRCKICDGIFEEREGRAVFVRFGGGASHVECAPPERIKVYTFNSNPSFSTSTSTSSDSFNTTPRKASTPTASTSSSRVERPPLTAPPASTAFPRWGSSTACPGCHKSVSPMERGVVPGPQGSRWHATCLVCGGKEGRDRRRGSGAGISAKKEPGCGKKLDSAAKIDGEGGVWCRECLLLLPASLRSPIESSVRSPIVPNTTGGGSFWSHRSKSMGSGNAPEGILPQTTGTTLQQQFTGMTGDSSMIKPQQTGRPLPARLLSGSQTRQVGLGVSLNGGNGTRRYPRPKSATGIRPKSMDEGRGMFLVRQLTGGRGT